MIAAHSFHNRKVALFGLGGSGIVTANSLCAGGADVVAWDDNPQQVELAKKAQVPVADLRTIDWLEVDEFVLSPGVPLTHPQPHWTVQLAHDANVPIIGDIEIFVRERMRLAPDCPFIAITGTNGKSTTTALISHIIEKSGRFVQMGGNIGTAILSLDEPSNNNYYVVECSSYQIELAPSLNPTAGILLNLSPDHLDRHGSMEHYAEVKEHLVAQSQTAIVGIDDKWTSDIVERLEQSSPKTLVISGEREIQNGISFIGEPLISFQRGEATTEFSISGIETLRGQHNAQNAAAAIAACLEVGLTSGEIAQAVKSFPGLKHRMQPVARCGAMLFVNDSKATNADATAPALTSFDDIFWILGGLAKDGGIKPLIPLLGAVRKAYLIGEAAASFAAELGDHLEYEIAETLELAVQHATADAGLFHDDTNQTPTILFSPSCASFDQFRNFEVRGDRFVELVSQIDQVEMLIEIERKGQANG